MTEEEEARLEVRRHRVAWTFRVLAEYVLRLPIEDVHEALGSIESHARALEPEAQRIVGDNPAQR